MENGQRGMQAERSLIGPGDTVIVIMKWLSCKISCPKGCFFVRIRVDEYHYRQQAGVEPRSDKKRSSPVRCVNHWAGGVFLFLPSKETDGKTRGKEERKK